MNILFISIAFPPKNDPESLQAAKYFKYLSRTDNAIDIVTSSLPTLYMPNDNALKKYLTNYRQCIELPIKENKYINFLLRKTVPDFLQRPDSKSSFIRQWKKVIRQLKYKPDIIYSRSFPLSSAFMAEKLSNYYQVPWIMHLSDIWADCPINNYKGTSKVFHEESEKAFFNKASYICITSRETEKFYKDKYKNLSDKFQFFPNVYDPDDISQKEYTFGPKLKFVYTGGLSDERSPKYLLDAIDLIYKEDREKLKDAEFIFAGQFDRKNDACLNSYNLPMVKNLGLLAYNDAQELQKKADVLLVLDTPFYSNHSAMFFPSKILDYIAAQRRMLALTNINSTTFNIINGKYGDCFAHNDTENIANKIREAVSQFRAKNKNYFYYNNIDNTYAADINASKLEQLMLSLVK